MATPSDHINQWRHNRQFLSTIRPDYPDWMVTVAFYTALHAVDALLATDRLTVTNHDERNGILIRTNRYKQIRNHYFQLYDLSRTVRYLANPATWTVPQAIKSGVIVGLLYPIEKSVQKLMAIQVDLPEITLQT